MFRCTLVLGFQEVLIYSGSCLDIGLGEGVGKYFFVKYNIERNYLVQNFLKDKNEKNKLINKKIIRRFGIFYIEVYVVFILY